MLGQHDVCQPSDGDQPNQAGMDCMMVPSAQATAIAHRGASASFPPIVVVVFDHFRWRGASGDDATTVAGEDRAFHGVREEAFLASDIQRLPIGAEDHPVDLALADQLRGVHGIQVQPMLGGGAQLACLAKDPAGRSAG